MCVIIADVTERLFHTTTRFHITPFIGTHGLDIVYAGLRVIITTTVILTMSIMDMLIVTAHMTNVITNWLTGILTWLFEVTEGILVKPVMTFVLLEEIPETGLSKTTAIFVVKGFVMIQAMIITGTEIGTFITM